MSAVRGRVPQDREGQGPSLYDIREAVSRVGPKQQLMRQALAAKLRRMDWRHFDEAVRVSRHGAPSYC